MFDHVDVELELALLEGQILDGADAAGLLDGAVNAPISEPLTAYEARTEATALANFLEGGPFATQFDPLTDHAPIDDSRDAGFDTWVDGLLSETADVTTSVGKAVNNVWDTPIPGVTTGSDTPGTFFDVVAALAPYNPEMAGVLLSVAGLGGDGTDPWSTDNIIVTGVRISDGTSEPNNSPSQITGRMSDGFHNFGDDAWTFAIVSYTGAGIAIFTPILIIDEAGLAAAGTIGLVVGAGSHLIGYVIDLGG